MQHKLWYLKRCGLFEGLTPQEADRLDRCALVRNFRRGSLVYGPTEPGESVLVLAEGRIKIKDLTPDGKETILAFIEPGELFGELALLDEEPRREYAEAAEPCRVLVLPRDEVQRLLESRPDMVLRLSRLVGLRRRRIETRLRNVLFLSSRERLMRLICELAAAYGVEVGGRCHIRLPLSHQDLASLIGVTRETVTHVLGQLQAEGLVRTRRRKLVVLDHRRLAAGCNGPVPVCASRTQTLSGTSLEQ